MSKLREAIGAASRALCLLGLGVLLAFAFLTVTDGLMRALAGEPLAIVRDLGGPIVAVAVSCCLPITMFEKANVTIRFGAALGRRAGLACDAFAHLLVLLVLAGISAELWRYAVSSARNGDASWMLGVPTAPFWFACSGILAFAAVAHLAAGFRSDASVDPTGSA